MRIELTFDKLKELQDVHREVNDDTQYVTDTRKYGVKERWENADDQGGEGDCEDHASAYYKRLRVLGWPMEVLDMVVCYVETGECHAVLAARCIDDEGEDVDMILDNRQKRVFRADKLPYRWLMSTVDGSFRKWRFISEQEQTHAVEG